MADERPRSVGAGGYRRRSFDLPCESTFEQPLHGIDERRQIPFNGGGDNRVIGVEVPVGQVVAHSGHVGPRDRRFALEYAGSDALHRLADLNKANSNGVVNQSVVQ